MCHLQHSICSCKSSWKKTLFVAIAGHPYNCFYIFSVNKAITYFLSSIWFKPAANVSCPTLASGQLWKAWAFAAMHAATRKVYISLRSRRLHSMSPSEEKGNKALLSLVPGISDDIFSWPVIYSPWFFKWYCWTIVCLTVFLFDVHQVLTKVTF